MALPVCHRRKGETKNEFTKRYTNVLYDTLPQTSLEDRAKHLDVRDKVIELNQGFFRYVVAHKFLNNQYIDYEDKVQGCIERFCECWTWYKFAKKYRTDLSFAVFYKPRLSEMLERSFDEFKYSLYRPRLMEVGALVGKHWAKVTYDDLKDPRVAGHISADHLQTCMMYFGSFYPADEEAISPFLAAPEENDASLNIKLTDDYEDVTTLLMHEMIDRESKLKKKDIKQISEIYDIPIEQINEKLPLAEKELYILLKYKVDEDDKENVTF